jgi:hypothetical protein
MAKKVLIHTQRALPNEDFITDIQLPLNAKEVIGMLVNAYDRDKGVTVSWGYDILQPTYTVAQFLADNLGLPEFLGRNVLSDGAGNGTNTETARDLYVDAITNAYIQSAIAKESNTENQSVFLPDYYNAKRATLKTFVNKGFFAIGLRPRWEVMLGVNIKTHTDGQITYGTTEPLRVVSEKKAWAVNNLKAWYNNFTSYMSSNPAATTPDYLETFFNEPSNFTPEKYDQAKVYVKVQVTGGRDGSTTVNQLVNAYTYFGNKYGYPDAKWFGYVPVKSFAYSFDAYRTAEIALNWFYEHVKYVKSDAYAQNINWDKTNVGELSVLFNSGRDIAVRDMPMDLNNNSKSVHYDLLNLSQKEQVNSFVRLVFKNNGKAVNPFYVKTYFFYQTI